MSLTNREIRATLAVAVFGSLATTLAAYNDGHTFAIGLGVVAIAITVGVSAYVLPRLKGGER